MAITVITQPTGIMPVHSPMMYLLTSTLFAEKNFKIKFEIVIGSETREVKISPRPDNKIEFNIASHLRDYLDAEFNPTEILTDNTDVAKNVTYQVLLSEEHIDGTTNAMVSSASTTLVEKVASNIVLNESQFNNYQEGFYTNAPSEGAEESNIMLHSKSNSTYYKDDIIWIHCVGIGPGQNRRFKLREYDKDGTLLMTNLRPMSLFTEATVLYKLDLSTYSFNVDTKTIGVEFFTNDISLNQYPLTYENRYRLEDVECGSFDKYRFVYLDKLGSRNTISLNYVSTEDIKINKENFRKRTTGLTTYFASAEEKYTLNTGNLNTGDMKKFEDLLLSTEVLLDVRSNTDERFDNIDYVPFMINTESMRRFKSENQQLAQYTIEGELGNKLNVRTR